MKYLTSKIKEIRKLEKYKILRKVLFVCLGNICRSPISEAIFDYLIKDRHLEKFWCCDSAALGRWHEGKPPDYRARKILCIHKIPYFGVARVIDQHDFNHFDYILGMDEKIITCLRGATTNCKGKIMLLGEFDPKGEKIIQDPYFDKGFEGFERCFQQCMRSCKGFLDKHSYNLRKCK